MICSVDKEEVLQEILKGISDMKELGLKSLNCPDITPWGFDELSSYTLKELDKLGYKLFSLDCRNSDGKCVQPTGLKITWE